jgi:hypothetical protein
VGLSLLGGLLVTISIFSAPAEVKPGGSISMAAMYAGFFVVGVRALWQGLTGRGRHFEEARSDANELRDLMVSYGASTRIFESTLPETEVESLKRSLRTADPSNDANPD